MVAAHARPPECRRKQSLRVPGDATQATPGWRSYGSPGGDAMARARRIARSWPRRSAGTARPGADLYVDEASSGFGQAAHVDGGPGRAAQAAPRREADPRSPRRGTGLTATTRAMSARSPVGDGDDIDVIRCIDVAVPDLHWSRLALDIEGSRSDLVLRLVAQRLDRDARRSPRFVADLCQEVPSDSLRRKRGRLPLDPTVELLDGPKRHYPSRPLVSAKNSSRVSAGAGSPESRRRIESSR